MKKATFILPIILVVAGLSAYGASLQSYGFNVANTRQENGQTVYTISEPNGFSFTVASANPITDTNAKVLQTVVSTLTSWKSLKISQARVVFNGERADILIIPSSFTYKGTDLARYMPSGMQFYYDKYLLYDFRMLKDNLFLHLQGEVYDERGFADRLYSAIQNPVLFLQTNNPEYLLKRLNVLVSRLETLSKELQQQKKELSDKLDRLSQNQDTVNTNLAKQLAIIKDQNTALSGDFDKVRYSLMALNNRGFFGQIYPIDRQAISRVVAMKEADPSLTKEQVMAKLKAEGVKMSNKEVSLVFDVYFNEFK